MLINEAKFNRINFNCDAKAVLGDWISEKEYMELDRKILSFTPPFKINTRLGVNRDGLAYTGYHQELNRVVDNMSAIEYFENISSDHASVDMNQDVIGGMPAISGSRIPVSLVVSCLRDGMAIEEICQDYGLSSDEVRSALNFIIDLLNRPFHEE